MPAIQGTWGDDSLSGTEADDEIFGNAGNDVLSGGPGRDRLYGGSGDDDITGGAGDDVLCGGAGDDILQGGSGNNRLYGGPGHDILVYNPGQVRATDIKASANLMDGGEDYDILRIDSFVFDPGSDPAHPEFLPVSIVMEAGGRGTVGYGDFAEGHGYAGTTFSGIEMIEMVADRPISYHGLRATGDMTVAGSTGDDRFYDGQGNDTFIGNGGSDVFDLASSGNDTILSGADNWDHVDIHETATGHKTLWGFNGAGVEGGDTLYFYRDKSELSITEVDNATVFDWGSGSLRVDAVGLVAGVDFWTA